jgi:hypothetical protein
MKKESPRPIRWMVVFRKAKVKLRARNVIEEEEDNISSALILLQLLKIH